MALFVNLHSAYTAQKTLLSPLINFFRIIIFLCSTRNEIG